MDITKLTTTELKAAGYDNLAQIEKCQNDIRLINQELLKRYSEEELKSETGSEVKDAE